MLRFLTAGESHGPALTVIVEGLPSGIPLSLDHVADELARRRLGYGRQRCLPRTSSLGSDSIRHDGVDSSS